MTKVIERNRVAPVRCLAYKSMRDCRNTRCPAGDLLSEFTPTRPTMASKKPGLYANIHAKQKRIASGSEELMRKPGQEGAPGEDDFKKAAKTAKPASLKKKPPVKKAAPRSAATKAAKNSA